MSTLKEKAEQILQEKEEKIIPENFSSGLEIFGVAGNIPTISNINKVVNSVLDLEENNQTRFMGDMENNTNIMCEPNTSIFLDCSNSDLAYVIGLTADKIKKDETILGITGTYEGEKSSGIRKLDLDVSEQDVYIQDWPQEGDVVCSISLPEGIEETDLNNGEYTLDFIMKDAPYEAEWVRLDGLNLVIGNNIEMGIDLMIGIRLTENWEGDPAFGYKEVRISFSA